MTEGHSNQQGTLSIALHPLVILTISDHFTRTKLAADDEAFNKFFNSSTATSTSSSAAAAAAPRKKTRIIGALLGTQRGREIEVCNCFELLLSQLQQQQQQQQQTTSPENDDLQGNVDIIFLKQKQEQFKKVFPDYDVLGWYTNGHEPRLTDINVHRQLAGTVTESPLLLMLDTAAAYASDTKELPVRLFESEVHIAPDGQPLLSLVPTTYRIATVESERIGVDHVAHSSAGTGTSQLSVHLMGMHGSIKMLNARIKILRAFVDRTMKGEIPFDHEIMRQIACICSLLPAIDSEEFRQQFLSEYNDTLLVAYLSAITKAVNAMNDLTDRYSLTSNSRFMAIRHHGYFA